MRGSDGAALAADLPLAPPASGAERLGEVRARLAYPAVRWCGATFGVMERVPAGWMMSGMERATPQEARDSLGWWFRRLAGDPGVPAAVRAAYRRGADRLDRDRPDELTVAGRLFRVVRADRFCRCGPDGPEPPRPGDPDALPEPRTRRDAGRFDHGLLPEATPPVPAAPPGDAWVPAGPAVPPELAWDARRALATHPRPVRLPARFTVAEPDGGPRPAPHGPAPHAPAPHAPAPQGPFLHGPFLHSPAAVREHLAAYFDHVVPLLDGPSPDDVAAYRAAAILLRDGTRRTEISVRGHRFRVARVEYVVRRGPDGPEPPRPSERDLEEPVTDRPAR
ncbi:hypothetical protein SAMN05443665_1010123 [Actinomadura meyerae]|uniref:PE-PGRS family protein n=1 Tax=Actinomadura meyerae TaxID=240840 RepID=A0A239HSH8_9ACTN|nr:DUF5954 family protein [Actinomadura meyerae]SNS84135.1 hypothetical protein SAMN05443665_1010123 [Actinomadura meyerae]